MWQRLLRQTIRNGWRNTPEPMSTLAQTPQLFPRKALFILGAALAVSLAAVAWARYTGLNPREPDAATVVERRLAFVEEQQAIVVRDVGSGQTLATLQGEQGFVRGVLRSFARERKRRSLPLDTPLNLLARADGRLTLQDPSTTHRIDLEAFGADNVAVFARWVPAVNKGTTP
jgi:putative photosynthetic complex assembly protein